GEKEKEIVLQGVARLLVHGEGRRVDRAIPAEGEAGQAAESGDVLVLLADRLAEAVHLDLTGMLRELVRMDGVAPIGVQRAEKRGGEAARGAKTGARGNIGKRGDLDLRRAALELA